DYDEKTLVVEEDADAGQIVGKDVSQYESWKRLFQEDSSQVNYSPFTSALDWRIARWAVKEGISQKALDRFLKIP
ncbi:hypothetical protein K435DRAFT_566087, partial [Dendrothele bispora CBS 962.96]